MPHHQRRNMMSNHLIPQHAHTSAAAALPHHRPGPRRTARPTAAHAADQPPVPRHRPITTFDTCRPGGVGLPQQCQCGSRGLTGLSALGAVGAPGDGRGAGLARRGKEVRCVYVVMCVGWIVGVYSIVGLSVGRRESWGGDRMTW